MTRKKKRMSGQTIEKVAERERMKADQNVRFEQL